MYGGEGKKFLVMLIIGIVIGMILGYFLPDATTMLGELVSNQTGVAPIQ